MGKGKRRHRDKSKGAGAGAVGGTTNGAATTAGDGRPRRVGENDILLSLEESVDWHNHTSGFVSSYALPGLSGGGGIVASAGAGASSPAGDASFGLSRPIELTRLTSLESTTSSTAGGDDDDDDEDAGAKKLRDIFRSPSNSPSSSLSSRAARPSPSSSGSPSRRGMASSSSPSRSPAANRGDANGAHSSPVTTEQTDCSFASDSTERYSNLTGPPGAASQVPPPATLSSGRRGGGPDDADGAAATAAAKESISFGGHARNFVGNVIGADIARDLAAMVSPLRASHDSEMERYADDDDRRVIEHGNLTIDSVGSGGGGSNAAKRPKKSKSSGIDKSNRNHNHDRNHSSKRLHEIQQRRPVKKNNLVIQHTPSNLSLRPTRGGHRSHRSLSELPPPHPLSHFQSYPPSGSRSPTRGGGMGGRHHKHTNSMTSMSDASMESEATPIISPGRTQTYSFSSGDTEEENEKMDEKRMEKEKEEEKDGTAAGSGGAGKSSAGGSTVPHQISTNDLKGIDITFTESGDDDDDDDNDDSGNDNDDDDAVLGDNISHEEDDYSTDGSSVDCPDVRCPPAAAVLTASAPPEPGDQSDDDRNGEYRGNEFFDLFAMDPGPSDDIAMHARQFSKDEQFFEGIHDSGLQSLSFEQVVDVDLNVSAEVETDLVYNNGSYDAGDVVGGTGRAGSRTLSRDVSGGSRFESSHDGGDDDGMPQNEEERRAMERRLLQWRKGRQKSLIEAEHWAEVDEDERHGGEGGEDDGYDMEMAPLTSSVDSPTGNGHRSVGFKRAEELHSQSGSRHGVGWSWRSTLLYLRNYILGWHLRRPDHSHHGPATPRKSNLSTVPPFNSDGWEEEADSDESRSLTSSSGTYSRKSFRHYDDVDFDRGAGRCCGHSCCYFCRQNDNYRYTEVSQPSTMMGKIHSGWKKLVAISSMFLLLAWVLSRGKLEKHHTDDYSYSNYIGNDIPDPLARESFIEKGHIVDDEDDYYWSHPMESPDDDDDDQFHSVYLKNQVLIDAEVHESQSGLADDTANNHAQQQQTTQKYNDLAGIDTIVVLSSHHAAGIWLVDRLDHLYPNTKVVGDFPIDKTVQDMENRSNKHHLRLLRRRETKIIDPTSNKFIHHLGNDANTIGNVHRKSKSGHILVVALFINPYDWVELKRVDPDPNFRVRRSRDSGIMDWEEFITAEFPSNNNMTILELRSDKIRAFVKASLDRDGVKLVIPFQYELLVDAYSNYDNYIAYTSEDALALPGIVGLLDQIQARTGLRPDETAGWKDPSKESNSFWAYPIGCTAHSNCFPSIDKMRKDAGYTQYINDHVDWDAEKLIGYQKMSAPKPQVDQIVVLGERNSGAEWIVNRLARCFPDTTVRYGFSRPGKWFQSPADKPILNTLVISVFLNPYDWVELMRQRPINAPTHKGLEWPDFVTSSWERKRSNLDNSLSDTTNAKCSFGFYFEEVVPCMTHRDPQSDSFPLYELHSELSGSGAGTPYSNILELRTDKIRNFLATKDFDGVVDLISLRYEDMVRGEDYIDSALPFPGIVGLLEKIRDRTSLVPDISAGWISDEDGIFRAGPLGVGIRNLDPYYVQWMEDHVDWDVEMLVGYNINGLAL